MSSWRGGDPEVVDPEVVYPEVKIPCVFTEECHNSGRSQLSVHPTSLCICQSEVPSEFASILMSYYVVISTLGNDEEGGGHPLVETHLITPGLHLQQPSHFRPS